MFSIPKKNVCRIPSFIATQLLVCSRPASLLRRAQCFSTFLSQLSDDDIKGKASSIFKDTLKIGDHMHLSREQHIERLKKYYSPNLIASILAAEDAVTPDQWAQRKPALGKFGLSYPDDLSVYDPFFDHAQHNWDNLEEPLQPVSRHVPPGITIEDAGSNNLDNELAEITGLNSNYISNLNEKVLVLKRVVNMTKLGKIPSQYCLIVVGDRNGMVGIGEGKDRENADVAIRKARMKAIKNLKWIPRLENRTVFGDFKFKFKAIEMEFRSRPAGKLLEIIGDSIIILLIC